MSAFSPASDYVAAAERPRAVASGRDPRLDFYRGIAMFIILVAHIPWNGWANWIPARFGFSDATEIFVFCSGMASAIAFGGAFVKRGWLMGTARVIFRCWQVYWAHICLFFFTAMMMAALDSTGWFERNYIESLNLQHFFEEPAQQMVGAFTLTYVPNYFDVLPMYLGVLAMMPLMMALARISVWLAMAASVTIWLFANVGNLHFPAEPWSDREWFFNPFGWQLLFFTGFAFMRGWLPKPPVTKTLIWLAAGFLILSAPIGSWKVFTWVNDAAPGLGQDLRGVWKGITNLNEATGFDLRDKTDFAILRYVHFLSLAYLAWVVAGEHGWRLRSMSDEDAPPAGRVLTAVVTKVGQQSLAVFVFSMAAAQFLGFVLDVTGRSLGTFALINLAGFCMITAVAYMAGWFKSQPWKAKKP